MSMHFYGGVDVWPRSIPILGATRSHELTMKRIHQQDLNERRTKAIHEMQFCYLLRARLCLFPRTCPPWCPKTQA
jgi:hypothetical protein